MKPANKKLLQAFSRGLLCLCPSCGQETIYSSYLKVKDECVSCGLSLKSYPADDAPPYIVTSLVGTIVVPLVFLTDYLWDLSELILMAIWLPVSILFILATLPPTKGSVVGVLWALNLKREK